MSSGTKHLVRDPVMAKLVERVGPIELKPKRLPVFQSLTQAIIYQQLSGKAAGTIYNRFLALFGAEGFPTPAQILGATPERLLSAGLSRPKEKYVRGVAQAAAAGQLPSLDDCANLTDADIVEKLTLLKGVGKWTVEMFLIFNLGRPDVLPVHDLGIRRGFQLAYHKRKMPEPEQLEKFGERWKPFRTLAARYLWRAVDGE
jgi:DNA-3-methyladenine glycosylase II